MRLCAQFYYNKPPQKKKKKTLSFIGYFIFVCVCGLQEFEEQEWLMQKLNAEREKKPLTVLVAQSTKLKPIFYFISHGTP